MESFAYSDMDFNSTDIDNMLCELGLHNQTEYCGSPPTPPPPPKGKKQKVLYTGGKICMFNKCDCRLWLIYSNKYFTEEEWDAFYYNKRTSRLFKIPVFLKRLITLPFLQKMWGCFEKYHWMLIEFMVRCFLQCYMNKHWQRIDKANCLFAKRGDYCTVMRKSTWKNDIGQ